MAKRISQLAKELGIKPAAVVEKCLAEGVPADVVKGPMSTVSVGLEASIREWFSQGDVSTTVENTAHVDIEQVRAAPAKKPRQAKKSSSGSDTDGGSTSDGGGIATAEPPEADSRVASPAHGRSARPQTPESIGAPSDEPQNRTEDHDAGGESLAQRPAAPVRPTPSIRPVSVTPVAPVEPVDDATDSAPTLEEPATAAAASRPDGGSHAPVVPPAHPAERSGHAAPPKGRAGAHVSPAPMNVPLRPKSVSPAGPQLQVKTPVKLSGPKIVRIEAPEVVQAPRPRRDGDSAGARPGFRPGGGAGTGTGKVGEEDDSARSPRRNKRKVGAPGADPAARGGIPARRRGWSGVEELPAGGVWSEQDLIEREARLSRAGGFLKSKRQALRRADGGSAQRAQSAAETGGKVKISEPFTIKDLSAATGVKAADIIKKLFMQGVMATVNSGIDAEKAQEIMIDFDIELDVEAAKSAEQLVTEVHTDRIPVNVQPRGPIVTILGHVDHGKTSLLDRIRNANVAAGEAGGITQKTSAFRVPVTVGGEEKHVLFLDTPGHEAFTSMRARGAAVTDIVVLVVSAPEGVMPQTVESINHAKAAGVPIVVALNKIDRPDATEPRINQTLKQLAEHGLSPVEWGGTTEIVRTSATKGTGVEQLLEILDLQGQMLELKADYGGPARGVVVESQAEEGRGATASVIVQDGELNVGDFIVVGRGFGKVRDIVDDRGRRHKSVGPATPVRISGFDVIPDAGDKFYIVDTLRQAQDAAEQRRHRERETSLAQPKVTLDSLLSQMGDKDVKEIRIVLKTDQQGTCDVLVHEIERVATKEVKTRVLHSAVGGITESDIVLADASRAVVIGFNVIPSAKARAMAEQKSVEIRTYQVIYEITDDIRKAAEGLLEPERRQQILGHAEVRQVFRISKVGSVAGCYVTDGVIERAALIRVTRNGVVIENDRVLEQLKRVKDDAKEVRAGLECGMKIVGYDDIKEGDVLECYKITEVKRTL